MQKYYARGGRYNESDGCGGYKKYREEMRRHQTERAALAKKRRKAIHKKAAVTRKERDAAVTKIERRCRGIKQNVRCLQRRGDPGGI